MSISTARKRARGRHALGSAGITSLSEIELRYLRSNVRFLLGLRAKQPSRYFTGGGIIREKRAKLIEDLALTFTVKDY
jgi:hypothetical protein